MSGNQQLREALARAEKRLDMKRMCDEEVAQRLIDAGMHPCDVEDEVARRKSARAAAKAWKGRNDGHSPSARTTQAWQDFQIEYPPQGWGLTEAEVLGAAKTCSAKYLDACGVRFTMRDGEIGWEPIMRGSAPGFERIRRITGYLVGTLDRFNNGKAAEERDRVMHVVRRGAM